MIPQVNCPICQRSTEFSAANPSRPFCSQRCKQIDLGEWAHDRYGIPLDASDPASAAETDPPSS